MDDAERGPGIRVDLDAVARERHVPQPVLGVELDLLDVLEALEHADSHLVDEVLDRLGDEVVERGCERIAHGLARHPLLEVRVTPASVEMDEQRPVVRIRKRRVLVAQETPERVAAELDQVEALPPGAMIPDPVASDVQPGDSPIPLQLLVEDVAAPLEGRLASLQRHPLDMFVAVEKAPTDEREELLQRGALELERAGVDEVL